jgi:carbamate kinase
MVNIPGYALCLEFTNQIRKLEEEVAALETRLEIEKAKPTFESPDFDLTSKI